VCHGTYSPISFSVPGNMSEIQSAIWGCCYVYMTAHCRHLFDFATNIFQKFVVEERRLKIKRCRVM
jgi:hypothetical protein